MVVGKIIKISGPVVVAEGMKGSQMFEVVKVGNEGLTGEIIQLTEDEAIIQVYEETAGIKPGEGVEGTGAPLSVELGPGMLKAMYDGIQRPLNEIENATDSIYIPRGVSVPSISREIKWDFEPTAAAGDEVITGDVIGTVQETASIVHKIMIPFGVSGKIKEIKAGSFTVEETVAVVETAEGEKEIMMMQKWPVRKPRPSKGKQAPVIPLITGQRVEDTFFGLAKGGASAIPGPFGSGKTVTQHQLAKWSDVDVVVYIGCGERGNEMTEVIEEFPHLDDIKTGNKLMDRTVLIANTSNMPVAAREASVYTGITIAEYFRDQGLGVLLTADSTSRWAEAMREISGRLEEMPGEEGYPAYLSSKLAQFYERAGRVECLGSENKQGFVCIVGAVSPPGGDFSEPVTSNTLRIVKVFWALDANLARRRHFPAINWLTSYSLYIDDIAGWWQQNTAADWRSLRDEAMSLLQKEAELQEIVQLVGPDALPDRERVILEIARMLREDFLQQDAYHEVDSYCSPLKQYNMLKIIMTFYKKGLDAVAKGADPAGISAVTVKGDIARMKYLTDDEFINTKVPEIINKMESELGALIK
ncbi:ATP synthase subunit A [Methanococcus maripaludis]|jgi:V/A-type H+-transporting ATPase subunit A|uniref:A-type ATP synthase subunit A n=3 Tax=Methanococcus maripaludis TaxID=39152 RepID=AATA_METMP|nr:ATP synthase subunit A [Methanococcus maripaludis]Q6LYE7.1 RecName: Full=V-type ATP synthase alpha chain; AltName: Full=V-ATPase subunit A [Methanococcus maripaludis S2]MDK2928792.1 V/A-type H+/Na+-transporting ATPase subunit [Methanococcus sp.]AEK20076.1 V-type ATP synthase subunit A [Methanococcus maripaludis X1]AVB77176.1 V-type sodium ATPase catalytic subunit A [Methanococcus maripaludis]MBA2850551.1 V/A-type H+-transporting ATPase subunit A [Methanococcus maripaludis]MBA2857985.1 V/A-